MDAFKAYDGMPTLGERFDEVGGVRVKIPVAGTFHVTVPYGDVTPGKGRYAFERYANGPWVGPEGTALWKVQAAVNAGKMPKVASGTVLDETDYWDSMYIAAPGGQTSLYAEFVGGWVRDPNPQPPAQPPAQPPPVVVPPPAQPPVAPPPAGPGLSAPEQRVDELWAWIGQQWPTVRPVAVAALKMFRKAVGR